MMEEAVMTVVRSVLLSVGTKFQRAGLVPIEAIIEVHSFVPVASHREVISFRSIENLLLHFVSVLHRT